MTWIRTHSGKRIDLLNPDPCQIDFNDIALVLGRICRFGGHTPIFYSVLQHSVEVGNEFDVGDPARKYALLHDAHEFVTGDIPTPVKMLLNRDGSVLELQSRLDQAIFQAAGLSFPMTQKVRTDVALADARVLRREMIDIIGVDPEIYEVPDLEDFSRHARIVAADDLAKVRIDWLQALELPVTG